MRGRGAARRRRRGGGQPGHPDPRQPAGRRPLRRRQHLPVARARRGHLRAVRSRGPRIRCPPSCSSTPSTASRRSTTATSASTTTATRLSKRATLLRRGDLEDLRRSRLRRPARRREPGHLVARPGVHAGDDRPLRRRGRLHVARLLGRPARQRRRSSPLAGKRPTTAPSRAVRARAIGRSSSRTRRARWPRSYFADPQPAEAPTGVIDDGCFRQVEFAGILAGTEVTRAGRRADRLHARPTSSRPTSRCRCSSSRPNVDVELPDVFVEHAAQVSEPLTMDPATIAANRERWLEEWTDVVLR